MQFVNFVEILFQVAGPSKPSSTRDYTVGTSNPVAGTSKSYGAPKNEKDDKVVIPDSTQVWNFSSLSYLAVLFVFFKCSSLFSTVVFLKCSSLWYFLHSRIHSCTVQYSCIFYILEFTVQYSCIFYILELKFILVAIKQNFWNKCFLFYKIFFMFILYFILVVFAFSKAHLPLSCTG